MKLSIKTKAFILCTTVMGVLFVMAGYSFYSTHSLGAYLSENGGIAQQKLLNTSYYVFGGGLFLASIVSAIIFRYISKLQSNLDDISFKLKEDIESLNKTSVDMASVSGRLSEAATQQAASLQETVASLDEISAMITRNADSASSSAKMSEQSTVIAQKGKEKTEQMMESINSIAAGNDEIIVQMQKSNAQISDIVKVIQNIELKTQVINDIVFQTKLLSFNASVEAARAGEHGKGFSVVAEEVGNLASMSGKAATEITAMLNESVQQVTSIVDSTKQLMDELISQSREKVQFGTKTARECKDSLDEILVNVSSVNEMVREISTASQEQSTGVIEINKAMSELDLVTQSNSGIALDSSKFAKDLNEQIANINALVADLAKLSGGSTAPVKAQVEKKKPAPAPKKVEKVEKVKVEAKKEEKKPKDNVVEFKQPTKEVLEAFEPVKKKVVGLEFEAPKHDDSRFEDV